MAFRKHRFGRVYGRLFKGRRRFGCRRFLWFSGYKALTIKPTEVISAAEFNHG